MRCSEPAGHTLMIDTMDDKTVINAVAAHRSLYDPSHFKYKDPELRNMVWQRIAGNLNLEVETLKSKWRALRDGFTRSLRHQREAKKNDPSNKVKPWRYQSDIEFLIPFINFKEPNSKACQTEKKEKSRDWKSKVNSFTPFATDSERTSSPNKGLPVIFEDNGPCLSFTSPLYVSSPNFELPQHSFHSPIDGDQSDSPFEANSCKLKRSFDSVDSDETADNSQCKRQELNKSPEQDLGTPQELSEVKCLQKGNIDDPTEAFFFSMSQSVKRLPFYLQAQVKMKVCQLVTDAELECLDSNSSR